MTDSPYRYLVIAGPTASGKSGLALKLATRLGGEIINCDSVQVYQGFDIGAAKPSKHERELVPHHLFDLHPATQTFDAATYARLAREKIDEVNRRGKLAIVVGGTGLYLRSLWGQSFHSLPKCDATRSELADIDSGALREELRSLDPKRASEIHPNDRYRLLRAVELCRLLKAPVSTLDAAQDMSHEAYKIKMKLSRPTLHHRIRERVEAMLSLGLVEEVEALLASGVPKDCKPMQSIGYQQVVDFLDGYLPREQLAESIIIATRQYAKRQETWFRKVSFDVYAELDESQEPENQIRKVFKKL